MSHQPVISDGQTMGTMGMRFVLEGSDGKVGVPNWRDVNVFNFQNALSRFFRYSLASRDQIADCIETMHEVRPHQFYLRFSLLLLLMSILFFPQRGTLQMPWSRLPDATRPTQVRPAGERPGRQT